MRHRTVIALAELQTALHEEYRDAVASRGLLEAELASTRHRGDTQAFGQVYSALRSALDVVRALEDAKRDLATLTRTLETL